MRIVESHRHRVCRSVEIEDLLVLAESKRNLSGKEPNSQHELTQLPEKSRDHTPGWNARRGGERLVLEVWTSGRMTNIRCEGCRPAKAQYPTKNWEKTKSLNMSINEIVLINRR